MQPAEYKFERFANPRFPIYLSSQSGRETLARLHYHTSAEIIHVTAGRIRLLSGSAHAECSKGDLIFVPPSTVHEVISLTEDAAIRGVIYEPSAMELSDLQLSFSALFTAAQRMQYVVSCMLKRQRTEWQFWTIIMCSRKQQRELVWIMEI